MNAGMNSLGEEDIAQLTRVMASLEASSFDYLELKVGDLEVVLSKSGVPAAPALATPPTAVTTAPPAPQPAVVPPSTAVAAGQTQAAPGSATSAASGAPAAAGSPAGGPGTSSGHGEAVTAPMMGIFYAQSEPGAAPFVTVGATVTPDTTVALIEVMKTFAPVPAGVAGTVTEICVGDGELVEFGQVLMRVEPTTAES